MKDGISFDDQVRYEQFGFAARQYSVGGVCAPSTFDVWAQQRVMMNNVNEVLGEISKRLESIEKRLAALEK